MDFAAAMGIEPRELPPDERERLRVEIDARVARAWQLSNDDLTLIFATSLSTPCLPAYREQLLQRLKEL